MLNTAYVRALTELLEAGWVLGMVEGRYYLVLGSQGFHDDTLEGVIDQARGFYA